MKIKRFTCKVGNNYMYDDMSFASEEEQKMVNKLGLAEDIEEKHNMSLKQIDAYITKSEKIEKAIKIVKDKHIDVRGIVKSKDYVEYNTEFRYWCYPMIKKSEFDLLKEAFGS